MQAIAALGTLMELASASGSRPYPTVFALGLGLRRPRGNLVGLF